MTTAALTTGFATASETLFGTFAGAVRRYVGYRRTLNALDALPVETLADLGLAGVDLKSVARAAAYRN